MAQCSLCDARKAKRACPALGRSICATCCGTKRLREIACPDSCSWLASAGAHPPAVVQRRTERDIVFLLRFFEELTEPQARLLMLWQGLIVQHAPHIYPPLDDRDVADAADAVAATLETAGKGILYQHSPATTPARMLSGCFDEAVEALSTQAGAHVAAVQRDAAVALRQLARAARGAAAALPGEEAPVFLKLLARAVRPASGPDAGESRDGSALEPPGSRLIITD